MNPTPSIVWLRLDLRLADHPALQAAAQRGGPVVPVFVWAPEEEGAWPPGSASRLSPHLHFGEVSPRQVWRAVRRFAESRSIPASTWRHGQFLTELGWRESRTTCSITLHNRVRMVVASFLTSCSRGRKARVGSGIPWWMRIWPTSSAMGGSGERPDRRRRPVWGRAIPSAW